MNVKTTCLTTALGALAAMTACQPVQHTGGLSVSANSIAVNGHCTQSLRVSGNTGNDSYALYVNGNLRANFQPGMRVDATYRVGGQTVRYSVFKVGAATPVSSGTLSCSA